MGITPIESVGKPPMFNHSTQQGIAIANIFLLIFDCLQAGFNCIQFQMQHLLTYDFVCTKRPSSAATAPDEKENLSRANETTNLIAQREIQRIKCNKNVPRE